ncbi:IS110 family transposase [Methylobacter psychrophilus]|uniref:IS110 family transposase n=1 Tax=Methylobacter psychrophilus TaxID=96941 RepID=UPI0021D48D54|nr:IS110 family transposase [Methylobacter psychrophilus]
MLDSIPGISEASIAYLLIAFSTHHNFNNAKQVVAFAGLASAPRESGQWRAKMAIQPCVKLCICPPSSLGGTFL